MSKFPKTTFQNRRSDNEDAMLMYLQIRKYGQSCEGGGRLGGRGKGKENEKQTEKEKEDENEKEKQDEDEREAAQGEEDEKQTREMLSKQNL